MIREHLLKPKAILGLLLALTLITGIHSCKRAAEKTTEKIVEKSIGKDAEVDIDDEKLVIKTDEGTFTTDAKTNIWPKEIPKEVPEFKEGKVISMTTQEIDEAENWVVIFEEVSKNALQNYKKVLENKGFNIKYTTTAETGGYLAAEKDKLAVLLMVGEGSATVTVGASQ